MRCFKIYKNCSGQPTWDCLWIFMSLRKFSQVKKEFGNLWIQHFNLNHLPSSLQIQIIAKQFFFIEFQMNREIVTFENKTDKLPNFQYVFCSFLKFFFLLSFSFGTLIFIYHYEKALYIKLLFFPLLYQFRNFTILIWT